MYNPDNEALLVLTSEVVAAYVQKNVVPTTSLPELIGTVHASLNGLGFKAEDVKTARQAPAVPVKKSIKPDAITCLECGHGFKSLKRHLRTNHGVGPDEYREKWDLPNDYPLVAPDYAERRSNLAKQMGLGQSKAKAASAKKSA